MANNITIIGTQWGDEGKGKLVDWLSKRADVVVRFQGGHNAGHTVVVDNKTFKLSLLPSGVVRPGKLSVIGNGVVIDPYKLIQEIETLRDQGLEITQENLVIADNATVILSIHRELDGMRESAGKALRIGTTRRGIGPAYEDKVGRRAIRIGDLVTDIGLTSKIERLLVHHNALRRGLNVEEITVHAIRDEIMKIAGRIRPFIGQAWAVINESQRLGKRLLFEGAQGVFLDNDYGTYPFVTSSNTLAAQAACGSGVGVGVLGDVLGVAKAYTTRVGEGPFPSELHDEIGEVLGERGYEFGTVTNRRRRCGWFDGALVRQAVRLNGIKELALTKLDVLSGIKTLKIAVGYDVNGKFYDYLPAAQSDQSTARPVYQQMPGWQGDIRGARNLSDLPPQAREYIARIEQLVEAPVTVISTGPERNDTIVAEQMLADLASN